MHFEVREKTAMNRIARLGLLLFAATAMGCLYPSLKTVTDTSDAAGGAVAWDGSAGGGGGNSGMPDVPGVTGTGGVTSSGGVTTTGGIAIAGGAGGTASTDAVTSTGGTVIYGGTTSGGGMGLGGAAGLDARSVSRADSGTAPDSSSTGVTCPRLPGLDPLICDFEHMTFNQTLGSYNFQGGDGLIGGFMEGAPPMNGVSKVEPTQAEAHSGTTSLAFTITGNGTATLRMGSLLLNMSAAAGNTVSNPYPCIDVSAYTGLEFWVKGTAAPMQITFYQQTGDISTTLAFSYGFVASQTWTWTKQTIPWTALTTSLQVPGAVFDPQKFNFISFDIQPITIDISLFLDDVSFTTSPTSTN